MRDWASSIWKSGSLDFAARVRSAANISDAPSRGDCDYLRYVLDAVFVETTFPELDLWLTPAGPCMDFALGFVGQEAERQPRHSRRAGRRAVVRR